MFRIGDVQIAFLVRDNPGRIDVGLSCDTAITAESIATRSSDGRD